ncbi:MAG: hypothetical protein AAGD11_02475 [Planctomycetota bacterium]
MWIRRRLWLGALIAIAIYANGDTAAFAAVTGDSNGGNDLLHAIGWQTFDNAGADNNSGIADGTPDSNSTFDSTPVGSNASVMGGGQYLTGTIGVGASVLGRQGFGQSTNNSFLQGPTFGSSAVGSEPFGMNITDVPLADGSPGLQVNAQGVSGSSWKFRGNGNQEFGDFSIKNESSFSFRVERIHFDARSVNENSPKRLELLYLASGDSNLIRADNDVEVLDLRVFSDITFPSAESNPNVHNVSQSIAAQLVPSTAARLAPGDSASFRFRWSDFATDFAEAQIDNLAISGTFLDQNNDFAPIDPAEVTATSGDFDADGDVDGADFLAWQRTDASAQGLSEWQDNYPASLSLSSIQTVPEPTGATLAAVIAILLGVSRPSRRYHYHSPNHD